MIDIALNIEGYTNVKIDVNLTDNELKGQCNVDGLEAVGHEVMNEPRSDETSCNDVDESQSITSCNDVDILEGGHKVMNEPRGEDEEIYNLSKEDMEMDELYKDKFETLFYTQETIPKNHLPYGLLFNDSCRGCIRNDDYKLEVNNNINSDVISNDISNIEDDHFTSLIHKDDSTTSIQMDDSTSSMAYNDSIEYIKIGGNDWKKDFIALTNLQIAIYNNINLLNINNNLQLIINFTEKNLKNLRSSVARNALLLSKCLIDNIKYNQELLNIISLKLLPNIIICLSSDKKLFNNLSKEILNSIIINNNNLFNTELFWLLLQSCHSNNRKISKSINELLNKYLIQYNNIINSFDVNRFKNYIESQLSNNNYILIKDVTNNIIKLILNNSNQYIVNQFYDKLNEKQTLFKMTNKINNNLIQPYYPHHYKYLPEVTTLYATRRST